MIVVLNSASALLAFAAAFCWAKVATIDIPDRGMTFDMVSFDWLTKPLREQSKWNRYGAICAALAAIAQVFVIWFG